MAEDFLWSDVVVAFHPRYHKGPKLLELCSKYNKKLIVDIDDYTFGVDITNPSYAGVATQDVYINDKPAWIDGVHYVKDMSIDNHNRWLHMMKHADMTTVTTPVLADFYQGFTDNLWVLPNSLDLDYYKPWDRRRPEGEIRIGWYGGGSHFKDFSMLIPVLKEIRAKNKNVKIVFYGANFDKPMEDLGDERVEFYPWVDSDTFPLKLGSLDLDIGLCPIEDTMFNKGKSNLKQIEYGAFNVPSVVSGFEHSPYVYPEGVTEHGVDGMVAENTTESWVKNIQYLVDNPSERVEMGKRYRHKVEALYNIKETWVEWRNCYEAVADQRILETAI